MRKRTHRQTDPHYMRIEKVIEVAIDIRNPIEICTSTDSVRQIIAHKFERKCFRGCFIIKVLKINRIGDCKISQDGHPDHGTLPVCFTVEAEEYAGGEIINGCQVTKVAEGAIICQTSIASIWIKQQDISKGIREGQMISIRVGMARYVIGAEKISVSGTLLLPLKFPVLYQINETKYNREFLDNVVERIKFERAELEKIRGSHKDGKILIDTFTQTLYACKEDNVLSARPPPLAKTIPSLTVLDIMKVIEMEIPADYVGKCFTRSFVQSLVQPTTLLMNKDDLPAGSAWGTAKVISMSTTNVLLVLLEDYCSYLRTLREMIGIYSTAEIIKDHTNLWLILAKSRF